MTKTMTGIRFATAEDALAYQKGDHSKAIHRGQSGWRKAPFEEVIIWNDMMKVLIPKSAQ